MARPSLAFLLATALTACPFAVLAATPSAAPGASPSAVPTGSPGFSPEPTAPPLEGVPSADCVNGWSVPPDGSALRLEGVELLTWSMGLEGPPEIADLRHFAGPDVPWIIEPHYEVVERWYIKASLADEADFRGRWLLEKRTDVVKGISAVAAWDSVGFSSPDWVGFVGSGPARSYPGLPGQWYGLPYDFVTGEGDTGQPGLPEEVAGCLDGT